ncbi:MAG: DUF294 nucleotidyltransferase-like domain-containing protein [Vibrio sp.]
MPDKFNMTLAPFDRLSETQQKQLRSNLDVAYFRQFDTILTPGKSDDHLYILMKGGVEETSDDGKEVFAHYAAEDMFDVRSLIDGTIKHRYTALEDTLSYLLPRPVFLELYQSNDDFAAYFDNNLTARQQPIEKAHNQQNLAEFILTRIDENIYTPALVLSSDANLKQTVEQMKDQGCDCALVPISKPLSELTAEAISESNAANTLPYGIVTRTDLLHAIALDNLSVDTATKQVAQFPLIHIEQGRYLFDAMILMTRHKCKRLVVTHGDEIVGILNLTEILSAFSTHSHVLTMRIANATQIDDLVLAASKQRELVQTLQRNGIRTRFIMELISALNEQIMEKTFELIVPKHLHDHCCLLVLGSEGRGEQILKTDQDNALIIKDGMHYQFDDLMNTFSETLEKLGYPPCDGKVMVNNPQWVKSQRDWKKAITAWANECRVESVMKLAILSDAHAIAGNKKLLEPLKHTLSEAMQNNEIALMEFARPALGFSVPLTIFGQVKQSKQGIDIKQGGIFPIVHGIRTLAIEHQILASNTFERIELLQKNNVLEKLTADNLSEALKLFIKWRLDQQINLQHSHNKLEVSLLNRIDRDLLRHSLHVVKKFKQWLGYHYQIRD